MKIIISNCWSFQNKGDAAIALATIDYIKKQYPESQITVLAFENTSFSMYLNGAYEKIKFLPMPSLITPLNILDKLFRVCSYILPALTDFFGLLYIQSQLLLFKILRHINKNLNEVLTEIDASDIFIAVGGNYLYSHKGLYNHLIPIMYANKKNKKVVLLGHSIGPFVDGKINEVIKNILYKSHYIVLREEISYNYIMSKYLLNEEKTIVAGDMAFLLDTDIENIKRDDKKRRVGVTIRQWFFKNPSLFNNYFNAVLDVINSLLVEGYKVFIIPFSYVEGAESDYELSHTLIKKVDQKFRNKIDICDVRYLHPSNLISFLRELNLDFFIGTRLHSVILASMAGIPSVIISYQHFKAYGISQQLSLNEFVVNIDSIKTSDLLEKVRAMASFSSIKSTHVQESVKNIRKSLNSQLNILMQTITGDQ